MTKTTSPGFGATVASEWTKLFTTRAPRRNLILGGVLGVAMTVLISIVTASTYKKWPEAELAAFDPVMYPLSGSILVMIFYIVFGVNAVAPEYSSGMIRQTFSVTPRRSRVILAKVAAVYASVALASLLVTLAMEGSAHLIIASTDLPSADWSSWTLWRTILASTFLGPFIPLLAVGAAFLLRSAAAAITSIIALIFLPMIIGSLLPKWWQNNIFSLFPGNMGDSVTIGHLQESEQYLSAWPALAGVIAWSLLAFFVVREVVNRRDV